MLPRSQYRLQQFKKFDLISFDDPPPYCAKYGNKSMVLHFAPFILCLSLVPALKMFLPLWLNIHSTPFDKVDIVKSINETVHFIMEPKVQGGIELVVMVNSRPSESSLRDQIRHSWANRRAFDSRFTTVMFLLGRPESVDDRELIAEEQFEHGDLLVTDMVEDYYLLSIKTYAMLYYKMTRLPKTKCLVKADSDNVLMLHNYEKLCEENIAPQILGSCQVDTRVLRNKSKWAVPPEIYALPRYPAYCSTGTYVFCGADVAQRLIEAARHTPFVSSTNFRRLPEDVLFTGIFAEKAGIRRKHVGGMTFTDKPEHICRDTKYTYSIHMHRKKQPEHFHKRLLSHEGSTCLLM